MRVTSNDLHLMCNLINGRTKKELCLIRSYGRVRLCEKQGAGYREISRAVSTREMYYILDAMINVLM